MFQPQKQIGEEQKKSREDGLQMVEREQEHSPSEPQRKFFLNSWIIASKSIAIKIIYFCVALFTFFLPFSYFCDLLTESSLIE